MVKQMTVAQFAHKLKVNRSTVYRMIQARALPVGITSQVIATHIVINVDTQVWKPK